MRSGIHGGSDWDEPFTVDLPLQICRVLISLHPLLNLVVSPIKLIACCVFCWEQTSKVNLSNGFWLYEKVVMEAIQSLLDHPCKVPRSISLELWLWTPWLEPDCRNTKSSCKRSGLFWKTVVTFVGRDNVTPTEDM